MVADVVIIIMIAAAVVARAVLVVASWSLIWTNQNNSGQTSVDRSAKTTLNTYNAWIQLSQLHTIYHICTLPCLIACTACDCRVILQARGPRPNAFQYGGGGGQQYIASMDSNLEAFSRIPSGGRFVLLASRLITFTMYLNEVFLSYWLRLQPQYQLHQ